MIQVQRALSRLRREQAGAGYAPPPVLPVEAKRGPTAKAAGNMRLDGHTFNSAPAAPAPAPAPVPAATPAWAAKGGAPSAGHNGFHPSPAPSAPAPAPAAASTPAWSSTSGPTTSLKEIQAEEARAAAAGGTASGGGGGGSAQRGRTLADIVGGGPGTVRAPEQRVVAAPTPVVLGGAPSTGWAAKTAVASPSKGASGFWDGGKQ
jgi:hypothetical protein